MRYEYPILRSTTKDGQFAELSNFCRILIDRLNIAEDQRQKQIDEINKKIDEINKKINQN